MGFYRLISFVHSQFKQIRIGGPRVFYNKIKRAFTLASLSVAAPLAVYFKMDWPQAYEFLARRSMQKAQRLKFLPVHDREQIRKLLEKTIAYLEKSIGQQDPDLSVLSSWVEKRIWLGDLYSSMNNFKQSLAVYSRTAEMQREIIKKYQLDSLDMIFIPLSLPQGAIGCFEYLECYIKAVMLGLRPNKKMILLLDPNAQVANPCFLKYLGQYIKIVSDPLAINILTPLEGYLTYPLIHFAELNGRFCWGPMSLGIVRDQWIKANRRPLLELSSQDHEKGWDTLRSFGLPQDAWFVTLHVREPGWKDRGSSSENFRNADIKTYFPAIKAVTDAGGWVIRIGDPTMSKLVEMPKVIDYAHSPAKSDWMDVFLCSQCRFLIGTSSGMSSVVLSFGVPLVLTNLLPAIGFYFFTSKDLFIPRLCFSKNKERYLNFNEMLSTPAVTAAFQKHFEELNLRVTENTAEEIKDLVEEMLQRFDGNAPYNEEDENLQEQFRTLSAESGKFFADKDFNARIHMRIGRNFLRKHSSLLPSGKIPDASVREV